MKKNKVKPVSIFEVDTTKITNILFLQEIQENFMSFGKMYCNKSQNLLSQHFLFKVSLFRFHFVSALQ